MPNRPSRPRLRLSALALAGAALAAAPPAHAAKYTFLGTRDAKWSDSGNWQNSLRPMSSALYDDEVQLGIGRNLTPLASTMDFGSIRLGKLAFDQGGGVGLTGHALLFGGGGTISVTSAATYTIRNNVVLNDNSAAANTLTVAVAANASLGAGGSWGGAGALVKTGAGTLALDGKNGYTGGTTIRGGTIEAGDHGALGLGDLTLAGGSLVLRDQSTAVVVDLSLGDGATGGDLGAVTGSGTLDVRGAVAYKPFRDAGPALVSAGLSLSAGQHAFSSTGPGGAIYSEVFSGAISGEGGIDDKSGGGYLALTGQNTYKGDTNLVEGVTFLGGPGALPATTALTVSPKAALSLDPVDSEGAVRAGSYSQTVASLAGAGHVYLGAATLTVAGSADTRFSGTIADNDGNGGGSGGRLVKAGTGTLVLAHTNSYTGGTTVNGGTLAVDATDALPKSGAVAIGAAGTLDVAAFGATIGALTGTGTVNLGKKGLEVGSGGGSGAFGGAFTGSGRFAKVGAGREDLSGANLGGIRGPLVIDEGRLAETTAYEGAVSLNGGTYEVVGGGQVSNALTGEGGFVKSGAGNAFFLASPIYAGSTTVAGGGLVFETAGTLDGSLSVAGGAHLANETGGTLTVSGKAVTQGEIDTPIGSRTAFEGDVSGAGGFSGFGEVDFDGGYSPGNSPGNSPRNSSAAVTIQGDVRLGAANDLTMALGGTALGRGYEHLTVLGDASLGGTLDVVDYGGFSPALGESFDLFDLAQESGTFSSVSLPALGAGLRWDASALYTTGVIRVTQAVPEPAALLPLGLGALALLRRRRV